MARLFITMLKNQKKRSLKKTISFYVTQEGNINMERLMSQELFVLQIPKIT